MRTIPFHKLEASGNNFVVLDHRKHKIASPKRFTKVVCDASSGIGADGVLLVERSRKADIKMRIINADGSEAEMCGNGARCIGRYADQVLKMPSRFKMETLAGIIGVKIGKDIRVTLSDPKDFREPIKLNVNGKAYAVYFINTGVPHAVVFVRNLDQFPVSEVGHKLRSHRKFAPQGTNVNFVQVESSKSIRVRTYERGVGETQACGTGVTASAITSVLSGRSKAPVRIKTWGGHRLVVDFEQTAQGIRNVTLEGAANLVYEGKYYLNQKG